MVILQKWMVNGWIFSKNMGNIRNLTELDPFPSSNHWTLPRTCSPKRSHLMADPVLAVMKLLKPHLLVELCSMI